MSSESIAGGVGKYVDHSVNAIKKGDAHKDDRGSDADGKEAGQHGECDHAQQKAPSINAIVPVTLASRPRCSTVSGAELAIALSIPC